MTTAKAALIIGAGDATGGAIARRFAREGFVACVTRRNADKLGDPVKVYDQLPGSKVLLRFATSEGAGDHYEMRNRNLLDQRVFDWLDDVLAS